MKVTTVLLLTVTVTLLLAASVQATGPADDERIAEQIRGSLLAEGALEGHEFAVAVRQGWVRLSGRVDSEVERETARRLAMEVPGVRGLRDLLFVDRTRPRTEDEIREDIEVLMERAGGTNPGRIQVDVERGVVRLSGIVHSVEERSRLHGLLSAVRGVTSVIVHDLELRVLPPEIRGKNRQSPGRGM